MKIYPVLVSDLSQTIITTKDKTYKGSLNILHKKLLKENSEYDFWEYFELRYELLDIYRRLSYSMHLYILTTGYIQEYPALAKILKPIFTDIFVGDTLGWNKAEITTYKNLAIKLKTKPNNIIYIDDSFPNTQAAKLAHINALQYISQAQIIKEIKNIVTIPDTLQHKKLKTAHLSQSDELVKLINQAYRGKVGWSTEGHLISGNRIIKPKIQSLINSHNSHLMILEQNNKILACINIETHHDYAHLGLLAVDVSTQNKGIGKQILKLVEQYIKKLGIYNIKMEVLSRRKELLEFYHRRGYKTTKSKQTLPKDLTIGRPQIPNLTIDILEKHLISHKD